MLFLRSPQFWPLSAYGGLTCLDLRVWKIVFFILTYSRRPIGLILCEPKTLHITSCFPKYGAPGPWQMKVLGQTYFIIFLSFYFQTGQPPIPKGEGIWYASPTLLFESDTGVACNPPDITLEKSRYHWWLFSHFSRCFVPSPLGMGGWPVWK